LGLKFSVFIGLQGLFLGSFHQELIDALSHVGISGSGMTSFPDVVLTGGAGSGGSGSGSTIGSSQVHYQILRPQKCKY
jgi:hypothetical protein